MNLDSVIRKLRKERAKLDEMVRLIGTTLGSGGDRESGTRTETLRQEVHG